MSELKTITIERTIVGKNYSTCDALLSLGLRAGDKFYCTSIDMTQPSPGIFNAICTFERYEEDDK